MIDLAIQNPLISSMEFQRIDLPSSIKITADLSISFWVQRAVVVNSSWPEARFLIDRDICSGARDWSVGLGQGGKIQFNTGTGGFDEVLTSTSDINDSTWHHIVVIRDSAGLSKEIYIDGQLNISSSFNDQQFLNNDEAIFIAASVCEPWYHKYYPGTIRTLKNPFKTLFLMNTIVTLTTENDRNS